MTLAQSTTDNSFTLTCISTGGPVTFVTWTRDSTPLTEGINTNLSDWKTSQFTHTLLVMDRAEGIYMCVIVNEFSSVSAELNVQGKITTGKEISKTHLLKLDPSPPSDVRMSQNGPNSLLVTWTPSEGPDVTGYTVHYQQLHGGQSGSVIAEETDTSAIINGLSSGTTFSISVSANSNTLSSTATHGPNVAIRGSYTYSLDKRITTPSFSQWLNYGFPQSAVLMCT